MPFSRRTLLSNSTLALLLGRAAFARSATEDGPPPTPVGNQPSANAHPGLPDTEWRHYASDQAGV